MFGRQWKYDDEDYANIDVDTAPSNNKKYIRET